MDKEEIRRHLRIQSTRMLLLLNKREREGRGTIYTGTVPAEEKARRRAKNKRARKSRKENR